MTMRPRVVVLANPRARGDAVGRASAVAAALAERGLAAEAIVTPDLAALDAAVSALAANPPSAVVAVGGDGTARAVAGRLARLGAPLALLPAGGGNFLAGALGLPAGPAPFAAALAAGLAGTAGGPRIIRLAIGRAGPEPFALIAGVGLDGAAALRINPDLKRLSSSAAYAAAILSAAALWSLRPPRPLDLVLDGEPETARWIMLTNARFHPSRLDLGTSDPAFTAVLIDPRGPHDLAEALARLALGRIRGGGAVRLLQCRRLEVSGPPGLPVHADGEVVGETPIVLAATEAMPMFARLP